MMFLVMNVILHMVHLLGHIPDGILFKLGMIYILIIILVVQILSVFRVVEYLKPRNGNT